MTEVTLARQVVAISPASPSWRNASPKSKVQKSKSPKSLKRLLLLRLQFFVREWNLIKSELVVVGRGS